MASDLDALAQINAFLRAVRELTSSAIGTPLELTPEIYDQKAATFDAMAIDAMENPFLGERHAKACREIADEARIRAAELRKLAEEAACAARK